MAGWKTGDMLKFKFLIVNIKQAIIYFHFVLYILFKFLIVNIKLL